MQVLLYSANLAGLLQRVNLCHHANDTPIPLDRRSWALTKVQGGQIHPGTQPSGWCAI